ncbi:hypothetical protein KAT59_01540, partial [Candidatus Bipolaricaulota bacterium]|nr:hypothetical protein [Candidatus Bipolaricaulota bacterium]
VDPIDVSGGWTGFMTWAEGDPNAGFTTPITLDLAQEGQTVSGEVGLMGPGSNPFALSITSGNVRGHSVSIEAAGMLDLLTPPANITISLTGDSDGERMSGAGTQTIDGIPHPFTWEVMLTSPPIEPS